MQFFGVNYNRLTGPVPAAPTSLLAGNSNLCGNGLVSSGNPAIDAAWVTAQDPSAVVGGNWPACQIPFIQVTQSILEFGFVPPCSYKDLTVEGKNIGAGILTGTVSAAPPFSIISGGNYSLGTGQSQQVIVRYTAPLQEGSQTHSLIFTGEGGITIQMKGANKKVSLPWLLLLLGN